jgi:hypothetical protein
MIVYPLNYFRRIDLLQCNPEPSSQDSNGQQDDNTSTYTQLLNDLVEHVWGHNNH